jgi:hypothetical protein
MKYNPPGNRYLWETTIVTLYKEGRKVEETKRSTSRSTITDKQRQVNETATRACREIPVAAVYVQAKIVEEYTGVATTFILTCTRIKKGFEKDIGEPELMPGKTSRFTGDPGANRKADEERTEEKTRRTSEGQQGRQGSRSQSDSGRQRTTHSRPKPLNLTHACEILLRFAQEENTPVNRDRFILDGLYQKTLYRRAAKNTHPDIGGMHQDFVLMQNAWEYLKENDYLK